MAKERTMTGNNLTVIKFESVQMPDFVEQKNVDFVSFGKDNGYPQYLIELFNKSAKHNAIVTGKVHFIKGRGFFLKEGLDPKIEEKCKVLLKNINQFDSADDLLYKTTTDLEIFSGIAIEVIPRKDKKGWSELNHMDRSNIRVSKDKKTIFYCEKWSEKGNEFYKPKKDDIKILKAFNPETFSGVYLFDQYRAGMGVYPLPEYLGCIPYIEVDSQIANFHLNNLRNGFSAGTLISFNNGEPTTEEKAVIEKKLKGKFAGTDNAGEIVIVFSDGKDSAPTIVPLQSNNFDKLWDTLNDTSRQEIFTGHKITSGLLFGIKEPGQLGGNNEIGVLWNLLKNGYVNAKQRMLLGVYNYLFSLNGLGSPLSIEDIEPVGFDLSEEGLFKALTIDEIRARLGEAPLKPAQQQVEAPVQMSTALTDEEKIELFNSVGEHKSKFKIHHSTDVEDRDDSWIKEIEFYKQGFDKVDSNPLPTNVNVKVMWSYELRSSAPPLQPGGSSRPFCKKMMALDKLYTRSDIDLISSKLGYDVWKMRGGFYHNPELDVTTDYCRHIWKQNIVSNV